MTARIRTRTLSPTERPEAPRPSLGVAGLDLTLAVSVHTYDELTRLANAVNKRYSTLPAIDASRYVEALIAAHLKDNA
jgi:hypothetical protein